MECCLLLWPHLVDLTNVALQGFRIQVKLVRNNSISHSSFRKSTLFTRRVQFISTSKPLKSARANLNCKLIFGSSLEFSLIQFNWIRPAALDCNMKSHHVMHDFTEFAVPAQATQQHFHNDLILRNSLRMTHLILLWLMIYTAIMTLIQFIYFRGKPSFSGFTAPLPLLGALSKQRLVWKMQSMETAVRYLCGTVRLSGMVWSVRRTEEHISCRFF